MLYIIINKSYNQMDILESALHVADIRNRIIQNNIANAELSGFKKSSVKFEDKLTKAIDNYKNTGNLDLSKANYEIILDNSNVSNRLDGNNVDIEAEMVKLYKNSAKYDVFVSSVINNYKRLNLVMSIK